MAGDWIKLEHTTPDKPEVIRIASKLAIDQDAVVGKLARIWIWADQNTLGGNALTVTDQFLDRFTACPGFAAALREVEWLSGRNGSLTLPNFDRHNGQTAKARAVTNRRVARHRSQSECNGSTVTDVTPPSLQEPLPEKRREEKSSPIPPPPADVRHGEICKRWGDLYNAFWGHLYSFQPKDAAALKRFLPTTKDTADEILSVAGAAWKNHQADRFARASKDASTIFGLCTRYNEIRAEIAAKKPAAQTLNFTLTDNGPKS